MAIGAHHFDNEPNFMTYRLTTNHMIISAGDPVTALKHGYFSRHEFKWILFRIDLFPILWCELLLLYLPHFCASPLLIPFASFLSGTISPGQAPGCQAWSNVI